jgi:hypothetical protein
MLASSGGFDKHIWMLPIEDFIIVAKELYAAREAVKQVIYEITGISDIIRGSSAPSETATAQDLKNKWGTVRLRRMQSVVANYARDLFRMSVDCGSDHVGWEQWKQITQYLDIPSAQEKQVAQQQLQYLQQQAQVMPPMPGPDGQPVPPSPPDPKLVKAAQSPSWEELLGKIKSDQSRTYIINIQASSTIDLDTAQDKADVNEFMNAMGQLLPGMQGFVALGPTGLEAAKAILMQVCLRYKFGIDIADSIAKIEMPPPPPPEQKGPPPPSPEEVEAIKAEAQVKTMTAQSKMKQIQLDEQVAQREMELALAEIEQKQAMLGIAIQEAQLRLQEAQANMHAQGQLREIKRKSAEDAAKAPKTPAKTS